MLNEQKGNMYGFVTHTWNPIKGKCFHCDCDVSVCDLTMEQMKKEYPKAEFRIICNRCYEEGKLPCAKFKRPDQKTLQAVRDITGEEYGEDVVRAKFQAVADVIRRKV